MHIQIEFDINTMYTFCPTRRYGQGKQTNFIVTGSQSNVLLVLLLVQPVPHTFPETYLKPLGLPILTEKEVTDGPQ